MSLMVWSIIGLSVGVATCRLLRGGILAGLRDAVLGVIGATVGGTLFHTLASVDVAIVHAGSMVAATLGAVLLLATSHIVRRGADASGPA